MQLTIKELEALLNKEIFSYNESYKPLKDKIIRIGGRLEDFIAGAGMLSPCEGFVQLAQTDSGQTLIILNPERCQACT
jgi:hypothetical protein